MEKFNRAVRRHHTARLKDKRKLYWGYHRHWGSQGFVAMAPAQLGKVVQYPQACSCPGCGNARAIEGRPLRERCGIIALQEELDALAMSGYHVVDACDDEDEPT